MSRKWIEHDVRTLDRRVAVVTGANSGLGFEAARVVAEHGASVVLAVRDGEKGERAVAFTLRACREPGGACRSGT